MEPRIIAQELGKQYHRYHLDRPRTLQEAIVHGLGRLRATDKFWALRNVNVQIPAGCMVGVIGHNGAGKSTLLSLLSGIIRPEQGRVQMQGRIGALLDLGTDFHPDLTGRENVFVSGVIGGLTRAEVAAGFDAIVAFAELEQFIDSPVRTYSSGMKMRLAFAVMTYLQPEILLIDEVLAVGDLAFQRKCIERIKQFKAEGCTIVFVSHDAATVRTLCDKAIWLQNGQMMAYGPAEVVVDQYTAALEAEWWQQTLAARPVVPQAAATSAGSAQRFGSLEMEITSVRLLNTLHEPLTDYTGGSPLQIEIAYQAAQPITAPIFGVKISREDGVVCYDANSASANLPLPVAHGRGHLTLQIERLDLASGAYGVDVGVYERNWAYAYDYHHQIATLNVQADPSGKGLLQPPHRWQCRTLPVPVPLTPPSKVMVNGHSATLTPD